jgi:hypothetical protein
MADLFTTITDALDADAARRHEAGERPLSTDNPADVTVIAALIVRATQ